MKKILYLALAAASLSACSESNLATQSTPAKGTLARVLRFDTTFTQAAPRSQAFRYTTELRVGREPNTTTIPVEIAWTSTQSQSCPQVASVQVFQLNGDDRRTSLSARVKRDGTCHAGLGPNGQLNTSTTGMAMVSLTGLSKEVRLSTTTSCLINALGYHDSLNYATATARR